MHTPEALSLSVEIGITPGIAHEVLSLVSQGHEQGRTPSSLLPEVDAAVALGPHRPATVVRAAAKILGLGYVTGREI